MNRRHAALVLRQELLDIRRNRQLLISLGVQPLIFLLVIVGFAYFQQTRSRAFETEEFKVVVHGQRADRITFEEALQDEGFRVVHASDLGRAVAGGDTELGLIVPDGARRALDGARTVALEVVYNQGREESQVARTRLERALGDLSRDLIAERLAANDLPSELATPLEVEGTDVGATEEGARAQLAHLIPGLLLVQAGIVVQTTAQRLAGSKEKRTLEPTLSLPISRSDILLGAGAAGFLMGLIPTVLLIAPVVVVTALPLAFAGGLSSPLSVGAALLLAAPLIAAVVVSSGLVAGTASRTAESGGSITNIVALPFYGMGLLVMLVSGIPDAMGLFAIPGFGAALFAREAIAGSFHPIQFGVALSGSATYAALALWVGAALLASERSILRPAS